MKNINWLMLFYAIRRTRSLVIFFNYVVNHFFNNTVTNVFYVFFVANHRDESMFWRKIREDFHKKIGKLEYEGYDFLKMEEDQLQVYGI